MVNNGRKPKKKKETVVVSSMRLYRLSQFLSAKRYRYSPYVKIKKMSYKYMSLEALLKSYSKQTIHELSDNEQRTTMYGRK